MERSDIAHLFLPILIFVDNDVSGGLPDSTHYVVTIIPLQVVEYHRYVLFERADAELQVAALVCGSTKVTGDVIMVTDFGISTIGQERLIADPALFCPRKLIFFGFGEVHGYGCSEIILNFSLQLLQLHQK